MGRCNTLDGNLWNSEINGMGDGRMAIGEDVSGRFSGTHTRGGRDRRLAGRCRAHSIWFIVEETNELYVGGFFDDRTIQGSRFRLTQPPAFESARARADEESLPPAGDEDWVATKT